MVLWEKEKKYRLDYGKHYNKSRAKSLSRILIKNWKRFVNRIRSFSFFVDVYLLICRYGLLSNRSWYSIRLWSRLIWWFIATKWSKSTTKQLCKTATATAQTYFVLHIIDNVTDGKTMGDHFNDHFNVLNHCSSHCFAVRLLPFGFISYCFYPFVFSSFTQFRVARAILISETIII